MLVRAAGRKQRRQAARTLAASFAQLNLPWLAPAQLRWSASQAVQSPARTRRRRLSNSQLSHGATRALATAAPEPFAPRYPTPAYSSAFNGSRQDSQNLWEASAASKFSQANNDAASKLRPFSDPIVINTSMAAPDPMIKVSHGISGTTIELLQYLRTSLQVGRHSRAEAILRRLAESQPSNSPELSYAHLVYLESMLGDLMSQGRGNEAETICQEMHRWFGVEVQAKSVTVDEKMLVVLIRGSIQALDGPLRDERVEQYVEMAQSLGEDAFDEVLFSEDYDDNEFTILGAITSPYFEAEPDDNLIAEESSESPTESSSAQVQRNFYTSLEDLPEVRETGIRSGGLDAIKQTMKPLADQPLSENDVSFDEQQRMAVERQLAVEDTSVEVAIDRWRKADEERRRIGVHTTIQSKPMSALMWQWHKALLPELQKELAACIEAAEEKSPSPSQLNRVLYFPFLQSLSLEKIAASTIIFTITNIVNRSRSVQTEKYELEVKVGALASGLGSTLESECQAEVAKFNLPHARWNRSLNSRRIRRAIRQRARQADGKGSYQNASDEKRALLVKTEWPNVVKVKLGAMLISKLLETAQLPVTRKHPRTQEKLTQMQPAFLHQVKYMSGKKIGAIAPNPAMTRMLGTEPLGSLIAKRMPMTVEPKPWSAWKEGGYMRYANEIMRLPEGDKSGRDYFLAAHHRNDNRQVYAGLNALGKVPWKIHPEVFKVQLEAWNSGEAIANFAPINPIFDMPAEPEPSSDSDARRKWLSEMRDIENKRGGLHSQRCFQNFQLEVARSMVNETLYFPHNMDFRGRAYPIPPYLNHMGADNVRGLLVFAEGKELGPDGLRWLKIHLATVAGHDKASLQQRIEFTTEHLEDIYDSARNPLNGRRWWLQAEDSWQTLAACFELAAALDSPDPAKFVSHLPIQQDGTCNGLQHYAALGGDKIGAAQVNLEPGDRPADVYTAVLQAVVEEVHNDALAGNAIAQKLDGHITRKCVKQPVMTNVYGVTWYGATEQVQRQLAGLFPDVKKSDEVNLSSMSQYIATKIFKSLGHMFSGAQAIQHWLGECAERILTSLTPEQVAELTRDLQLDDEQREGRKKPRKNARATSEIDLESLSSKIPLFKSSVIWTTPLRMPVVQPYRQSALRVVRTNLQRIGLQEPQIWHPVSKRKQLQAFPPNFIHSLDATHMFLSALKCSEVGITFASIHDSFWCHAADVNRMSELLRDAFIAMHKENIVGRLREEFQMRYKGCMYLAGIPSQSKVGKKVTEWRQKNLPRQQRGGMAEFQIEVERQRLLNSSLAADREKGREMVTPATIVEQHGHVASSASDAADDRGQTLGNIPIGADDVEALITENMDAEEEHATEEAMEDALYSSPESTEHSTVEEIDHDDPPVAEDIPTEAKSTRKKKPTPPRKIGVWMPLTFPPVPPKGDFDVTRLSSSTYFFH